MRFLVVRIRRVRVVLAPVLAPVLAQKQMQQPLMAEQTIYHNGAEMVTWMQDNAKKIINGDDLEPSEYHHIKEKKKFWLFR